MSIRSFVVLALAAITISACASRAGSVAPVAVSSVDYNGLTCSDAREQLRVARDRQSSLARQQNNAAVADAAGVFLFLVPVGSIVGADVSGELAQAKGEVLALERSISVNCGQNFELVSDTATETEAKDSTPAASGETSTD